MGDRPLREALSATYAQALVLAQQLQDRLVRQRPDDPALSPGRLHRRPESVQDRLLGRIDDRREEVVEQLVGDGRALAAGRRLVVPLAARRRQREKDLAASVVRDRSCSREPESRAAGDTLELSSPERGVRHHDGDAAPGRPPRAESVADHRKHRQTVDAELGGRAEVREHEHTDRRLHVGDDPARCADAALPAERHHPGPRPDAALGHRPAGRRCHRTAGVRSLDLNGAGVVEPAVVAFADDRDHDVVDAHRGIRRTRDLDRAVVDPPDGHRRGEVDGSLDQPPFRHLDEPGQLACAVQHGGPGRHRTPEESLGGAARIAVTPVLAQPRPTGGSGSSRVTVTCPTRTPGTSVIAFSEPGSREPIRSPCPRSVVKPSPLTGATLPR